MIKKILFFAAIALVMQSCYYDKEDVLYPSASNKCDTLNVTFADDIQPIMQNYCTGCHGASGGVNLESYAEVKKYADNGLLYGTVSHTSGSAMPKGGNKISACKIRQIEIWIQNGAKND